MGFGSFNMARRTIRGYEAMNMIRKGQVEGVERGDVQAQTEFVSQLFGIAGSGTGLRRIVCPNSFLQHNLCRYLMKRKELWQQ
jgi:hypothetical protein